MYNKRQTDAENCGREPLASNQVVESSNLSGRAKVIKHLTHFRKFESSHKNKNTKVVIDGWGTIIGSIQSLIMKIFSTVPSSQVSFFSLGSKPLPECTNPRFFGFLLAHYAVIPIVSGIVHVK